MRVWLDLRGAIKWNSMLKRVLTWRPLESTKVFTVRISTLMRSLSFFPIEGKVLARTLSRPLRKIKKKGVCCSEPYTNLRWKNSLRECAGLSSNTFPKVGSLWSCDGRLGGRVVSNLLGRSSFSQQKRLVSNLVLITSKQNDAIVISSYRPGSID